MPATSTGGRALGHIELTSDAAAGAIEDPDSEVLLSAVVAWEIAIKRALGTLQVANRYVDVMLAAGCRELPITIAHAKAVDALPPHHNDPFDRLLVAQALDAEATIVTRDRRLASHGAPTLW